MITGVIPYMFIEDDSLEAGVERLREANPGVEVALDHTCEQGSHIKVSGSWENVFQFLITEYSGCEPDSILQDVACFKMVTT